MSQEKQSSPMVPFVITVVLISVFVAMGIGLSRYVTLPDFLSIFRTSPWSRMHNSFHDHTRSGDYEKAEGVIRTALAYAKERHGESSWQTCISLTDLSSCLKNLGRYEEGLTVGKEALKLAEVVYAESRYLIARNLQNLGEIHYYMEEYGTAEEWFVKAREIMGTYDADADDVANLLDWLSTSIAWQERWDETIPLYEEMLKLYGDSVYFADEINDAQVNMAAALAKDGDFQGSQQMFTDAMATAEKHFGNPSQEVGGILLDMAYVHADSGRHRSAEELYRKSIDHLKGLPEAEYPDAGTALDQLAEYYTENEQGAEAIRTYREMLLWYEDRYGEIQLETVYPNRQLGLELLRTGQVSEAVLSFRRVVDIVESAPDADDEEKNHAYLSLANALEKIPDMEQAAVFRAKANALDVEQEEGN